MILSSFFIAAAAIFGFLGFGLLLSARTLVMAAPSTATRILLGSATAIVSVGEFAALIGLQASDFNLAYRCRDVVLVVAGLALSMAAALVWRLGNTTPDRNA